MTAHYRQPGVFTTNTARTDIPQRPTAAAYGEGAALVDGAWMYSDAVSWAAMSVLPEILNANIIPRNNTRSALVALGGNAAEIASSPQHGKLVLFNGNAGEAQEFDTVTWKTVKNTFTPTEITNLAFTLTTDEASHPRMQIDLQPYINGAPATNEVTITLPGVMPDSECYIKLLKPNVDLVVQILSFDTTGDFRVATIAADTGNNPIILVRDKKPAGVVWEAAYKGSAIGAYNNYELGNNSLAHGDGAMATNTNAVAIGNYSAATGTNGLALSGGKSLGNNVIAAGSGSIATSGVTLGLNARSANSGMALGVLSQSGGAIYEVSTVSAAVVTFAISAGDFRGRVPATGTASFRYVPTAGTKYKAQSFSGTISSWAFSTSVTLTLTAAITSLPSDFTFHGKLYLVVVGGGAASGIGPYSDAPIAGQQAYSGISFDTDIKGTVQSTRTFLMRSSTATTAIELTANNSPAAAGTVAASNAAQIIPGSNARYVVPSNKFVDLRITVLGKHTGASANAAKWVYRATAINNNGTVTLLDGPTLENQFIAAGMGTPTVAITAANCAVQVSVTPGNATASRWCAVIDATELGF